MLSSTIIYTPIICHDWICSEIDRIKMTCRDFHKSYILKLQQNHSLTVILPLRIQVTFN